MPFPGFVLAGHFETPLLLRWRPLAMLRPSVPRSLDCSYEEFFNQCDPERENLCLYGHSDGRWEVTLPVEEVPPEIPEPALGINFARDGMKVRVRAWRGRGIGCCPWKDCCPRQLLRLSFPPSQKQDWLALCAVHSDCWLMSVAFFHGARFDRHGRDALFRRINSLATVYETVTGRAANNEVRCWELPGGVGRLPRPRPARPRDIPRTTGRGCCRGHACYATRFGPPPAAGGGQL